MAMLALISQTNNIKRHKVIDIIGQEERKLALEKFNTYKRDGVIRNDFCEDVWILSDEKNILTLDFIFNEVYIKKYLSFYSAVEFKDILKCFICLCFGQYVIGTLQEILFHIKELLYNSKCLLTVPAKRYLLSKTGIQDFIGLMPFACEEICFEEEKVRNEEIKRRDLAEYQSYFLFGKILEEFWENKASTDEKTFFYPIYLWWNITMILPVRVTEFTLTPKECLTKNNTFLKIRRSKLKGSSNKRVSYKIDEDYEIFEYAVSKKIADMILEYKNFIKGYKESEIDSIFVDELYVNDKSTNWGFFHAKHFSRLLDTYYCDIIEKYYNYEIIPKDKLKETSFEGEAYRLKNNEIVKISLGDSRHIAMQNLLLNGCNILMAKEITGHENPNIIFHYSGNMKNLIKCKAYSLFEMSKRKEIIVESLTGNNKNYTILGDLVSKFVSVDKGKCFSPYFTQGDMRDCYVVGGDCDKCDYIQDLEKKKRDELIRDQEAEVEKTLKRIRLWLSSDREFKTTNEYIVATNQLKARAENLQNMYIKRQNEDESNGK